MQCHSFLFVSDHTIFITYFVDIWSEAWNIIPSNFTHHPFPQKQNKEKERVPAEYMYAGAG